MVSEHQRRPSCVVRDAQRKPLPARTIFRAALSLYIRIPGEPAVIAIRAWDFPALTRKTPGLPSLSTASQLHGACWLCPGGEERRSRYRIYPVRHARPSLSTSRNSPTKSRGADCLPITSNHSECNQSKKQHSINSVNHINLLAGVIARYISGSVHNSSVDILWLLPFQDYSEWKAKTKRFISVLGSHIRETLLAARFFSRILCRPPRLAPDVHGLNRTGSVI